MGYCLEREEKQPLLWEGGGGREKLGKFMGSNVGGNKAELLFHRSYENVLQLPNIAKFHTYLLRPNMENHDHKEQNFHINKK